jgi:UDP-N-acetyl-D-mannosaminuronic acid dehydrogenase
MESLIYSLRPELINKIYFAYCPERVIPGNIVNELVNNDRVVGGTTEEASKKASLFYANFVKGEIFITNARTAEMCKLTENASRDVQIAFANELSMMCEELNIDHTELINLANKHCIAVDPWFLVSEFPNESNLIKKAREVNTHKTQWCIDKILNLVSEFSNQYNRKPKIGCFGLAYKPNVDDLRESPAVQIVDKLIDKDVGHIIITEPNVTSFRNWNLNDYNSALEMADIVVFLVNHSEFSSLNINKNKIVMDLCGVLDVK